MKKRRWLSFLILGLLFVSPVFASSGAGVRFFLNAGVIADDHIKNFHWQVGSTLDLPVGGQWVVAPELTLIGYKFDFKSLYLYPGATINYKLGDEEKHFFLGGGAMLYFRIKPKMVSGEGTELLPKIQIGYKYKNIKITAYLYSFTTDNSFLKEMFLGLNLGVLL